MKLDNMTEVLTLTNPSNNGRYLLNLAQPVYADEETKTLIKMIQLLAEENQYLRKENKRLAKMHR
ncbi:hypothetical protein [Arsenophonus endosymbiont of Crataerina pallida]|uniref:hypothetical protein n=1 Tax=Arsenophonus endosymbiont of Crataerina pallida TaxID=3066235 RepID=UPI0030D27A17